MTTTLSVSATHGECNMSIRTARFTIILTQAFR